MKGLTERTRNCDDEERERKGEEEMERRRDMETEKRGDIEKEWEQNCKGVKPGMGNFNIRIFRALL